MRKIEESCEKKLGRLCKKLENLWGKMRKVVRKNEESCKENEESCWKKWGKLCKMRNEESCEEKWGKFWGKMRKVVRKNGESCEEKLGTLWGKFWGKMWVKMMKDEEICEESNTKNVIRGNVWGTLTTILRKNGGKSRKNEKHYQKIRKLLRKVIKSEEIHRRKTYFR